jgi:UDP-glucose 4-epimerase
MSVIHAAGEGVGRPASQTTVERVNVIGTENLLAALEHRDPRVVVVLGSANEYAPSKNRLTENSSLAPVDWYGATKLRSYATCTARSIEDSLPLVYLRMFYVYGPGEQSQRPLAYAIASVRRGEAPTFTSGRQIRDFVYVADAADLVVRAASSNLEPGTVINVGAGRGLRLREVIEPALELLNHESSPKTWSRPYRDAEIWYQVADPSRAKTMLGWEATTPIAAGLHNCIFG